MAIKKYETEENLTGQKQSFEIPTTGNIDRESFRDEIQIIDTPNWDEKAKALAFMEEPVTVLIHKTDNPKAEHVIQVAVNGINQFIIRGIPQVIKRKYAEVLLRSKPETLETEEFKDSRGEIGIRVNKFPGQKYQCTITDTNPDGKRWLSSVQAEA